MTQQALPTPPVAPVDLKNVTRTLDRLYRTSVVILTGLILIGVLLFVGRAAVYKIHDRLQRPALVSVNRSRSSKAPDDEAASPADRRGSSADRDK